MRQTILFLLRTYNDIDHIIPVIWKLSISGWRTYFLFVGDQYLDDKRIQFATKAGAIHLRCKPIEWYHQRLRRWLWPGLIRRVTDRLVAYTLGRYFVQSRQIQVIANEWSGAYGREMAEYFLRPANGLRLPCISLPHGYIIWKNKEVNRLEVNLMRSSGKRPDFTDRNIFSAYVVQNEDAKQFLLDRGLRADKLTVMGSSRFCPEWFQINYEMICDGVVDRKKEAGLIVLFFVPDWEYNVKRKACVTLIERLATLQGVSLIVKVNTRGTGSFSENELRQIRGKQNVFFPNIEQHSTVLIRQVDIVINFASSIGLEAILQGKPVCNPIYLNGNTTIFDESGVVFDAKDDSEVVGFIETVKKGNYTAVSHDALGKFREKYVLGGKTDHDVLQSYVDLFSTEVNKITR